MQELSVSPTRIYGSTSVGNMTLHWTELETGEENSHEFTYDYKNSCSWCEVPGNLLYFTGGGPSHDVLSVNVRYDFSVTIKPPMISAREYHNSCYYGGFLYVIGGAYNRALKACERFNVAQEQWDALPAMPKATRGIGLVVLGLCLFVIGGRTNLIQELQMETLSWRILDLRLPSVAEDIACFKGNETTLWFVLNYKLYSLNVCDYQLQLVRNLSQDIKSYYGPSYYFNGILYATRAWGSATKLQIGPLTNT